jgi:hypothetical protein
MVYVVFGLYILSCVGAGVWRCGTSSIDWAQLSRLLPKDGDRIQSPKRCVLNKKTGQWIMSRHSVVVLIYHRHKLLVVLVFDDITHCLIMLHISIRSSSSIIICVKIKK